MADLLTLEELKERLGIPAEDDESDPQLEAAILDASDAIRSWTGRNFGEPTDRDVREYEYNGTGFLDIDDATEVFGVEMVPAGGPNFVLDPSIYRAQPFGESPYTYIRMPLNSPGFSPEMGFTRNLDVAYYEGKLGFLPTLVQVDADWGYPTVPDAVKRAAVWTTLAFKENPGPYVSESIEGYSRTVGPSPQDAIPGRAQVLLAPYTRLKV